MKKDGRHKAFVALCVAPATILFTVLMIIPTLNVFRMSLFERGAFSPTETFVGMKNFQTLLNDATFIRSMQNTILLIVVVISGIFSAIYQPDETGLLNSIIGLFRNMADPIRWKGESLVMVSLIIAMVWQAIGYYMVMYMASMSAISESLYESANLEGASRTRQFFSITLPLIWTNLRTTLTFFIISNINMSFLFVRAMTGGGPDGSTEVFLSYMYSQAYTNSTYGYGMAIGVVVFSFSFALSALVNFVTKREPLEM